MARKLLQSFKSTIKDAKRRGLVAQNVAAETTIGVASRHKRRLKAGVDFPLPDELRTLIAAAEPKARAIVCLAGLAGLRASELRGLRWADLALGGEPAVTVAQRADRWSRIGSPKSESSQRTVPLGETAANALRACCVGAARWFSLKCRDLLRVLDPGARCFLGDVQDASSAWANCGDLRAGAPARHSEAGTNARSIGSAQRPPPRGTRGYPRGNFTGSRQQRIAHVATTSASSPSAGFPTALRVSARSDNAPNLANSARSPVQVVGIPLRGTCRLTT